RDGGPVAKRRRPDTLCTGCLHLDRRSHASESWLLHWLFQSYRTASTVRCGKSTKRDAVNVRGRRTPATIRRRSPEGRKDAQKGSRDRGRPRRDVFGAGGDTQCCGEWFQHSPCRGSPQCCAAGGVGCPRGRCEVVGSRPHLLRRCQQFALGPVCAGVLLREAEPLRGNRTRPRRLCSTRE